MALRAWNASPWGLATLTPQSTCHGRRPRPTRAPWCSGRLPAFHGAECTRKDPRPEEKKMSKCQKNTFIMRSQTRRLSVSNGRLRAGACEKIPRTFAHGVALFNNIILPLAVCPPARPSVRALRFVPRTPPTRNRFRPL